MLDGLFGIAKKVFGDSNTREIKRLQPLVQRINALEPEFEKLDHAGLLAKTAEMKEKISRGATVDDVIVEAFATCREGSKRALGMRHYDCQLIGGLVLHQGKISEMKTGEGKTLVATSAVYANALAGKGVHVVTVNDYLASRDAEWMGQLYKYLGLSIGQILSNDREKPNMKQHKRSQYACDITYGTNNEFGFDYLRDNMEFNLEDFVQRGHHYGIVDEVDSILIDEARTPLIISGPAAGSLELYEIVDAMIPTLQIESDFLIDEKNRNVSLTDEGVSKVEGRLGVDNLYSMESQEILHHVMQSLKAHHVFKRDKDYVVRDGKVTIVDEFTGRLMQGRRWSDGLHQAVEAKEKVKIEPESQVYATVTFQNYFRMYSKLAGMTGTAETEAGEFASIYKLDTIVIPTNRPTQRIDVDDVVYKTRMEKYRAVLNDIRTAHAKGQPVLVGTTSVEKSEIVAELLRRDGIPHEVLNAKNHGREAHIVAQAGRKGAVTISTNMAGRGTDIRLGGNAEEAAKELVPDWATNPDAYAAALEQCKASVAAEAEEVKKAGGLHIIGTERHESRRIDNQLRGRAGRQGDPGSSKFFLALEDDLLRLFGSDKVTVWMERMGLKDDEPIEHKWITAAVENAQRKVEGHHFQMRKNILEYDDVMNYQRKGVYDLRKRALAGDGIVEMVDEALENVVNDLMDECAEEGTTPEQWPVDELRRRLKDVFDIEWSEEDNAIRDHSRFELKERILTETRAAVEKQREAVGEEVFVSFARMTLLQYTDQLWKEHLLAIDRLRQGVGLRGYGQRNPLLEYKRDAFHMFLLMSALRDEELLRRVCLTEPAIISAQMTGAAGREKAVARQMTGQAAQRPLAIPGGESQRIGAGDAPGGGFQPLPRPQPLPQRIETQAPVAAPVPQKRPAPGEEARAFAVAAGVRRNDPCPCGSGNKFKKCCGSQLGDDPPAAGA